MERSLGRWTRCSTRARCRRADLDGDQHVMNLATNLNVCQGRMDGDLRRVIRQKTFTKGPSLINSEIGPFDPLF